MTKEQDTGSQKMKLLVSYEMTKNESNKAETKLYPLFFPFQPIMLCLQ